MKPGVISGSGGIGGALRATLLLLDHDTLSGAGTGVGRLVDHAAAQN